MLFLQLICFDTLVFLIKYLLVPIMKSICEVKNMLKKLVYLKLKHKTFSEPLKSIAGRVHQSMRTHEIYTNRNNGIFLTTIQSDFEH